MNITKEETGELTALLKVEVSVDDYSEKVNKALKEHQRKANMPGFRPGKVPFGLVKKMYGHAVVADEVNKLVSDGLADFLRENNISILGQPLPNDEKTPQIDWHEETDVVLYFNLGLAPSFELNFSDNISLDYFRIKADEETLEEEISHMRETQGSLEHPEISGEKDWLNGEMIQIDDAGNVVEGGLSTKSYIFAQTIAEQEQRQHFIGLKAGDVVDFDIRQVFSGDAAIARAMRMTESKAKNINGMFRFQVSDISRMVPAEMDSTFFEKVFPGHGDMDEDHFRQHIRERIENSYSSESDKLFMQEALDKIIEANPFHLPDDFLKQWIFENSRKETTPAQVELDYPKMVDSFKWDLIRQKINEKYSLDITEKDVREYVKSYFTHRYGHQVEQDEEQIREVVHSFMQKEKEVEKLKDELYGQRLLTLLKTTLGINNKEVSLTEFLEISAGKTSKNEQYE